MSRHPVDHDAVLALGHVVRKRREDLGLSLRGAADEILRSGEEE